MQLISNLFNFQAFADIEGDIYVTILNYHFLSLDARRGFNTQPWDYDASVLPLWYHQWQSTKCKNLYIFQCCDKELHHISNLFNFQAFADLEGYVHDTMLNCYFLSLDARRGSTLKLRMMMRVFNHCATATDQSLAKY